MNNLLKRGQPTWLPLIVLAVMLLAGIQACDSGSKTLSKEELQERVIIQSTPEVFPLNSGRYILKDPLTSGDSTQSYRSLAPVDFLVRFKVGSNTLYQVDRRSPIPTKGITVKPLTLFSPEKQYLCDSAVVVDDPVGRCARLQTGVTSGEIFEYTSAASIRVDLNLQPGEAVFRGFCDGMLTIFRGDREDVLSAVSTEGNSLWTNDGEPQEWILDVFDSNTIRLVDPETFQVLIRFHTTGEAPGLVLYYGDDGKLVVMVASCS